MPLGVILGPFYSVYRLIIYIDTFLSFSFILKYLKFVKFARCTPAVVKNLHVVIMNMNLV